MNFITYLKQMDAKRLSAKRLVIYTIYLLAPIVLIATTLSTDRIITKCEDIEKQNFTYLDRLKNCGSGNSDLEDQLRNEIRQLQKENSDLLAKGSRNTSNVNEALGRTRERLAVAQQRNSDLEASLLAARDQLSQPSVKDESCRRALSAKDQQVKDCQAKYESAVQDNRSLQARIAQIRSQQQGSADKDRLIMQWKQKYEEANKKRRDIASNLKQSRKELSECKLKSPRQTGKPPQGVQYLFVDVVPAPFKKQATDLKGRVLVVYDNGNPRYFYD